MQAKSSLTNTRNLLGKALYSWSLQNSLRRLEAEVKALAIDITPLPLFELIRLCSLDPFVPRASTFSHHTSGKHFLVLAESPMGFIGGQRSAHLALQLLGRSHRVTYVYLAQNPTTLSSLGKFAHTSLTHVCFRDFSCRSFALEREAREQIVVLCELPSPEYRSCARFLGDRGAQTVYDCVENWSRSAPRWYSRRTEEGMLQEANLILASSPTLGQSLQSRTGRTVCVLPNAVDTRLFARGRNYPRHAQFSRGKKIFLYVGTLHDEALDRSFLVSLAQARPDATVVVVGTGNHAWVKPPSNILFLGLQPQTKIPALIAHADVCLLPFFTSRSEGEHCPLRVYEYVAMGKPVVASDTPHLHGFPQVLLAKTQLEFIQKVEAAATAEVNEEEIGLFVSQNSWKTRMRQFEQLLER